MGARLDDLVAILGHAVVEVGDELFVRAIDPRVRHSDSLEDAEHGGRERPRTLAHAPPRCVDDAGSSFPIDRLEGCNRYG